VNERDLEAWRGQTNGSFSLRMLPGDHFFLKQPVLLRVLSEELEQSR
jgi:surfactin synthase thioesterase subunit